MNEVSWYKVQVYMYCMPRGTSRLNILYNEANKRRIAVTGAIFYGTCIPSVAVGHFLCGRHFSYFVIRRRLTGRVDD